MRECYSHEKHSAKRARVSSVLSSLSALLLLPVLLFSPVSDLLCAQEIGTSRASETLSVLPGRQTTTSTVLLREMSTMAMEEAVQGTAPSTEATLPHIPAESHSQGIYLSSTRSFLIYYC